MANPTLKQKMFLGFVAVFCVSLLLNASAGTFAAEPQAIETPAPSDPGVLPSENSESSPTEEGTAQDEAVIPIPLIPPLEGFRVIINQGQAVTANPEVSLSFEAGSDVTQLGLSNNPDFLDEEKIEMNETVNWNICAGSVECGSGEYSVFARFYNLFGTASETVSAGIRYEAPVVEGQPVQPAEPVEPEQPEQTEVQTEHPEQAENSPNNLSETLEVPKAPVLPLCSAQPIGTRKAEAVSIQRIFRESIKRAFADFAESRARREDVSIAKAKRDAAVEKARADREISLAQLMLPMCPDSNIAADAQE